MASKAKKTQPTAPARSVPAKLERAVAKLAKKIEGRCCWGLPYYELTAKHRLTLVDLGALDLFSEGGVDPDDHPGWLPFATFRDDPQFLTVSTASPYAVGLWWHEDNRLYPLSPSLEAFTESLLDKKDKTPFELLDKTLDKVDKLVEDDAHEKALRLLEPALAGLPTLTHDDAKETLARAQNLSGLALKGLGRFAEARTAWERAVELGEDYAELNVLNLLLNELHEPRAVIDRALAARGHRLFDEYGRSWTARYLAEAYLEVGEIAKAEAELRGLVARCEVKDAKTLQETRADIEKYVARAKPNAEAARGFLAWLHEKLYAPGPAAAKELEAWWAALPQPMQAQLLDGIGKKGEVKPTASDIARCRDVDHLFVGDDARFDDVAPFLPLARVATLSFYGDPATVEPLRALPALKSLRLNNGVVKDFKIHSAVDRALLQAAEAGDRKGIDAALAAGGSLAARDRFGHTALALAARKHDAQLCAHLIALGSDPWAGSHHGHGGGSVVEQFLHYDEATQKLIGTAVAKSGLATPEASPWRVLSWQRQASHATFDSQELGRELRAIDEGVSLAAKWPADAKLTMQSPQRENKLYDVHGVDDGFLVSPALAALLRGAKGLELLAVTLLDHAKKPRGSYFLLNPLAVDCLVIERCFPKYNLINDSKVNDIAAQVIDPARVGGAEIFRCVHDTGAVILSRELAQKVEGCSGVRILPLKR